MSFWLESPKQKGCVWEVCSWHCHQHCSLTIIKKLQTTFEKFQQSSDLGTLLTSKGCDPEELRAQMQTVATWRFSSLFLIEQLTE